MSILPRSRRCRRVFDVSCSRYKGALNPVQAAIDDAVERGGGTVLMPAPLYSLRTTIRVPFAAGSDPEDPEQAIHIRGAGPNLTVVRRELGFHDMLSIERSFTQVSNITFDGEALEVIGNGITIGQLHDPGNNDNRVFSNIALRNVIVRGLGRHAILVRGGPHPAPFVSGSTYSDCIVANNVFPQFGAVKIEPRCVGHSFARFSINAFRGYGLWLDGCEDVSCIEGHFEDNRSDNRPYAYLNGARNCRFVRCWFEEENATAPQFFIELEGNCDGTVIDRPYLVRKGKIDEPLIVPESKAIWVKATAPSRGVLVIDPLVSLGIPPAANDTAIVINTTESEVSVLGGLVEVRNPLSFKPLEIEDLAKRSVHLAPDRRLRIPQLSASDIGGFVTGNRRVGDVINRDITGLRTGSGLEAFNGGNWISMTVNRYATITDLRNNETSKDRGSLAWVDSAPGTLRVWDSTDWWTVIRRIGAYDNTGLGTDAMDLQIAAAPGGGFMYRLSVMAKVTTTDSQTLIVKAKWNDGSNQEVQMFTLDMSHSNEQSNAVFAIYLASGDIRVTTNAMGSGRYTLRVRAEVL